MKKYNKMIAAITVAAALITVSITGTTFGYGSVGNTDDYDHVIAFVHTNDTHGQDDFMRYIPSVADEMKELYGEENVIIADAGDTFTGAPIAGLTKGEYVAPIMNAVGYDVMTLGNADIVLGTDQVLKDIEMCDFPVLSANWMDAETGEHLAQQYATFMCDGVKVGVFGISTDDLKSDMNHPFKTADFDETVNECLAALEEEQCDVIAALVHIGYGEDYEHGSMYLADNFEGIDLIIDGHSHTELPEGHEGKSGSLVVQTGCYGDNIGISRIYLKDGDVVGKDTELIPVYKSAQQVDEVLDELNGEINEMVSQVVGGTDIDLVGDFGVTFNNETELGDLVTDAIRAYTGADAAIYPSVLMRATLKTGDITLNDLLTLFGAGCDTYVVDCTGAQLKEVLSWGFNSYPETFFAFPQISGIRVTYDPEAKEFTDLTWEDGTAIGDDETFKLAIDFLYIDNLDVFDVTGEPCLINGQSEMAQVVADYMGQEGFAIPETGRINSAE